MQVAYCADVAFGTGMLHCVTTPFNRSICMGDHGDVRLIMTEHTIILSVHGRVLA